MVEAVRQIWREFDDALGAGLAAMGLELTTDRREQLFEHYRLVVEANRQFNLTRITSPAEAAVKHYADSLSLLTAPWVRDAGFALEPMTRRHGDAVFDPVLDSEARTRREASDRRETRRAEILDNGRGEIIGSPTSRGGGPPQPLHVLDVGTGAGYPAVPLAVACPTWSITAIDGTGKKVQFVAHAAETLGLANLNAMHARAADLAREGEWRFDLVLVRAVGQMAKVLAETAPLLGSRGAVVFYKTAHMEQAEVDAAAATARKLRLKADVHRVDLPLGHEVLARQLIRYGR